MEAAGFDQRDLRVRVFAQSRLRRVRRSRCEDLLSAKHVERFPGCLQVRCFEAFGECAVEQLQHHSGFLSPILPVPQLGETRHGSPVWFPGRSLDLMAMRRHLEQFLRKRNEFLKGISSVTCPKKSFRFLLSPHRCRVR
jgi:hypothetical protein